MQTDHPQPTLAALRLTLVEARARLRTARDRHDLGRAECEQATIDAAGGHYGRNDAERGRFLLLAYSADPSYQAALIELRVAELAQDTAEAIVESAKDSRRAAEWSTRDRLIDALAMEC